VPPKPATELKRDCLLAWFLFSADYRKYFFRTEPGAPGMRLPFSDDDKNVDSLRPQPVQNTLLVRGEG
jgi:hypothetical protein